MLQLVYEINEIFAHWRSFNSINKVTAFTLWVLRLSAQHIDNVVTIYNTLLIYTVWVKKVAPPKTFCNIFNQIKYISVKFCQYVASLYLDIFTNFRRFALIFNKMAVIFLGEPTVFNVSSFTKSNRRDFVANNKWSPIQSNLKPLDYQAWGKCWSLITNCNRN